MSVPLRRARFVRNGILAGILVCLAAVLTAMRPTGDPGNGAVGETARAAVPVGEGKAAAEPFRVGLPSEPSPLVSDPYAERFAWQPKELRAVLGTHRGRHFGAVADLCYSPDGKLLASSEADGSIRLWQANTLLEVDVLTGHTNPVWKMAFSPNGKLLASLSGDHTIRLWDLSGKKGKERAKLSVDQSGWRGVLAFSMDGTTLWSALEPITELRTWTIGRDSVKERAPLSPPNLVPLGYSFSANGTRFAAEAREKDSYKHEVGLWDTTGARLTLLSRWGEHKDHITNTHFSPDGRLLVSRPIGNGGEPFTKIWDVSATPPRLVAELPNTSTTGVDGRTTYNSDYSYAVSPDNRLLAKGGQWNSKSNSYGPEVELWDLQGSPPRCISRLIGHATESIYAVTFSPDGKTLATGSGDGLIQLWDLRGKKPAPFPLFAGASFRAKWMAVSPVGEAVAVGGSNGTVRIFEHDRGLYYERGMIQGGKTAAFAPDGKTLAVAGPSTVRLWDFHEGRLSERTGPLPGVRSPVRITFAPDGKTLAVGDANGEVRLWSLTGPNHVLRGPASPVKDMLFRAAASELTVLHENRTAIRWNPATAAKRGSLVLPDDGRPVALLPDGRAVGATNVRGQIRKWEWTQADPVATPLVGPHGGEVRFIAADRTGKRLASVGTDRCVVVWDVPGGKKIVEWQFPGMVEAVAFTPDARRVVTLNGNGTCYVLALPAEAAGVAGQGHPAGAPLSMKSVD